jgi:hypothetical protein
MLASKSVSIVSRNVQSSAQLKTHLQSNFKEAPDAGGRSSGAALIRGVHQGAWKNAGPLTDGVRRQPRAGLHYGARRPTVCGSANAAFIVEVLAVQPIAGARAKAGGPGRDRLQAGLLTFAELAAEAPTPGAPTTLAGPPIGSVDRCSLGARADVTAGASYLAVLEASRRQFSGAGRNF